MSNELTCTQPHLDHLEAQIREVEQKLAGKLTKSARKVLEKHHEQLVISIQRWTVGAAKPGEVL